MTRLAAVGIVILLTCAQLVAQSAPTKSEKAERPDITIRASPQMLFSPAKVSVRAELKGGANDFEDYYCSTIEWVWGDGTASESSGDCEPYEPGKSEIRRYYSNSHTYNVAGRYEVRFRMKKADKVVGFGAAVVQVRPGIRDIGPYQ
jgi:hypothetical protein